MSQDFLALLFVSTMASFEKKFHFPHCNNRNKLAKRFQKWDTLLPHISLWNGCRSNNAE